MNKVATTPPRLVRALLEWKAGRADTEDLLGDLDEEFYENVGRKGKLTAHLLYTRQVLSLCFSYALSRRKDAAAYSHYYTGSSLAMVRNYFTIAVRNFGRHKFFTAINMVGLALGMSVCVLALSIAVSIFRFDEFHEKKERIYQVNTMIEDENERNLYASTFNAVGDHLGSRYPFIESVVRVKSGFRLETQHRGNSMSFNGYFADPAFFEVFSFPMLAGHPATALADPFSVVLTRSVAERLYKNQDPVGQVLETVHGPFHVTGVIDDLKETHFYFEVITSHRTFDALRAGTSTDWTSYRNSYVYLLLQPGTTSESLSAALAQTSGEAEALNPGRRVELRPAKLGDVIPTWDTSNVLGVGWDLPSLIFFMVIGLLILLPAIFNYTNLSIARALTRAREIGIRKVVGATRRQVKMQFIAEAVLLTFLALVGSLVIVTFIKPEFLDMVITAESLDTSPTPALVAAVVVLTLLIGLFAGMFPAVYFSRLNPVSTLKGRLVTGPAGVSGIKKGLFAFQFFLSLVFIIGVASIARQYVHVFNYDHGFESANVLAVPFHGIDKQLAINEFRSHPDVKGVTTASNLPGVFLPARVGITPNGTDTLPVGQVFVGKDFTDNLRMQLVWGDASRLASQLASQPASQLYGANQTEEPVLVNEEFLKATGVFGTRPDSLAFTLADGTRCRVVGILKNFNFEPLSQLISPLMFRYSLEHSQYALLTVQSGDIRKTLEELEARWNSIDQKPPFEPGFLDDEIEEAYYFLVAQIKIFSFLSAMAITISCLGLLGMVSYTTSSRTKEIAIRKIMGASVGNLYYTLTRDFVQLILLSAMVAIPFSYFFYDFVFLRFLLRYGNGIGMLETIGAVGFLFCIGFVAIYWQTSRAANANPADSLRYE